LPEAHACELPHPPQLLLSVWRSTHAPAHTVDPVLQVKVQTPLVHEGWASATAGHACPHEPQLSGSVVVSMQTPPHAICGWAHVATHVYDPPSDAQRGVVPLHAVPQLPQLDVLSAGEQPPSHALKPAGQAPPASPSVPADPSSPAPPSSPPTPSGLAPSLPPPSSIAESVACDPAESEPASPPPEPVEPSGET
jgi:hypothetical protein